MSETPNNPQPSASGSAERRARPQPTGAQPPRRRSTRRYDDEAHKQRLVVLFTAGAIAIALIAVISGILYEQVWLPSRPVAQVGETTLSRSEYWDERRDAYIREIVQNFQLLALFGGNPQFTQQFQNQSPNIQRLIDNIRSADVDGAVVSDWIDRQVKQRGLTEFNLTVSDEEVNQTLVRDLGPIFLPPPAAPPAEEGALEATAEPTAEATAETTPEAGLTATPAATATPEATATLAPTLTPLPTPGPAEAADQVEQIFSAIFRSYEIEMAGSGLDVELTVEDFRRALLEQYREQVLNSEIQAALVPEESFEFAEDAEQVRAQQVLVAVETPADATQEQIDAAFAEALPQAEEIAAELRGGADIATVAQEQSDDLGSRDNGGDLGLFDRDGLADNGATYPPELVEAAFALEEGAISDPIRTQFGWHVLAVNEQQLPDREEQLRTARTAALDEWVAEQRAAAAVQRFPEPTPSPTAFPTEAVPTSEPIYQPGPPTAIPTPTAEPTVEVPAEPTATP